jgi:hypothetical protein
VCLLGTRYATLRARCVLPIDIRGGPQLSLQGADVRREHVTTADTLPGIVGQQGFESLTPVVTIVRSLRGPCDASGLRRCAVAPAPRVGKSSSCRELSVRPTPACHLRVHADEPKVLPGEVSANLRENRARAVRQAPCCGGCVKRSLGGIRSQSCGRGAFSIHLQGRGQTLSCTLVLRELVYALM